MLVHVHCHEAYSNMTTIYFFQAMYIRVKRIKVTYFIQCDPTETILGIKQKLHAMIDEPPTNQKLVLRSTQVMLDDSNTLAEQGVSYPFHVTCYFGVLLV